MKRLLTALLIAQGLMFQGFAQTNKQATKTTKPASTQTIVMKNLLDSFSYAAGLNIASNMKDQGISEINEALMVRAIKDAFSNGPQALTHCRNTYRSMLKRKPPHRPLKPRFSWMPIKNARV